MSKTVNMPEGQARNLPEVIQWRNSAQADFPVFTFLLDGEKREEVMTYGQLDADARRIAAWLQNRGKPGDRVMMLFPPGLDFIRAFFGCLYANMVAIPLYPHLRPGKDKILSRIQAVAADASPLAILHNDVVERVKDRVIEHAEDLAKYPWQNIAQLPAGLESQYKVPNYRGEDLAFLQYTSGSTSTPKGVMVSHDNIMSNLYSIYHHSDLGPESKIVSWLPPYHDMGLIGGILEPAYAGIQDFLMPPVYFLQRPFRWLKAISDRKAGFSGGPNFAYDYCVKKVRRPEQLEQLDLSHWKCAFSGAEPISGNTLKRFADHFKPCGFSFNNYYPCYGLAEGTLMVTAHSDPIPPVIQTFDAEGLERHQALPTDLPEEHAQVRVLVGSGTAAPDTAVRIVHPDTMATCSSEEVGEIWISGGGIAQGYWNRPGQTRETFQAYTSDTKEGPFMRTGDLGFLRDGQLFVTGRIKDLIIIDGSNHYPQDIEWTAEQAHEAIRPHGVAAFSVPVEDSEKLVLVVEVDRRSLRDLEGVTLADIEKTVRSVVSSFHDLRIYDLKLTYQRIPKTTSGKIQHHHTRNAYLEGAYNDLEDNG